MRADLSWARRRTQPIPVHDPREQPVLLLDPSTHHTQPIGIGTDDQDRPRRVSLRRSRRPVGVPIVTWLAEVYDVEASHGDTTLRPYTDLPQDRARELLTTQQGRSTAWTWRLVRRVTTITEEIVP